MRQELLVLSRIEHGVGFVPGPPQRGDRAVERGRVEEIPAQCRSSRVVPDAAAVLCGQDEGCRRQALTHEAADARVFLFAVAHADHPERHAVVK